MTTFQACMGTGMTLNNDVTKGVFDRFRSLPIARSAPLVGAVLADFVRYLCASACSWRWRRSWDTECRPIRRCWWWRSRSWWRSACASLDLRVRRDARAPTRSASGLDGHVDPPRRLRQRHLRARGDDAGMAARVGRDQSLSLMANTLQGLLNGGPVGGPLLGALGWMVGVVAVFFPLAMLAYRRR